MLREKFERIEKNIQRALALISTEEERQKKIASEMTEMKRKIEALQKRKEEVQRDWMGDIEK